MADTLSRADRDPLSRPRRAARRPAFLGFLARHPGRTALGGVFVLAAGGILVNALALQSSRHPAPLFADGHAKPTTTVTPPTVAALPPERPGTLTTASINAERPAAERPAADKTAEKPGVRPARPATAIAARDPIAEALHNQATPPAKPADKPAEKVPVKSAAPKAAPAKPAPAKPAVASKDPPGDKARPADAPGDPGRSAEANRQIVAAQRALNKLGFGPIKADGLMGSGTRQAIEQFERKSKLPVTGALGGRVPKELAQASGVVID